MANENFKREQVLAWNAIGGFFQRFNGQDHACIPLEAFRACGVMHTPAVPAGKRERMAFYEAQMKDPANHAALAMEMAYLRSKADERAAGYCDRGGGCVCGGDLPAIRERCSCWVKP